LNIIYKGGTAMETIIRFKNRETTAKHGKLPEKVLIFTDVDLQKIELDIIYEAVKYEIAKCAEKELYNIIEVYINLMIDIEDIIEEVKNKYKKPGEYIFQFPLHVLELDFLIKALKDYELQLKNINEENNDTLYRLNLLVEKTFQLLKNNYKDLRRLFADYDKTKKLKLLKDLWNKLYELSGED
jgi:hypothetical protein